MRQRSTSQSFLKDVRLDATLKFGARAITKVKILKGGEIDKGANSVMEETWFL